jgi:glycerol-3-phosphate O-acyltransferase
MLGAMLRAATTILGWTAALVVLLAFYEVLRALVIRGFQGRLRRSVDRAIREKGVRLDRYKFTQKFLIRDEILNDVEVNAAILDRAAATSRRVDHVREEVEGYIDEIVPVFSLVSYYQLGSRIARIFMNWLYEVVVPPIGGHAHPLAAIPPGAALVYVANHRSNADYVAIAYTLIDEISLSYATGEWARVWPLESLFKSFGAYFVRRGFPDPLYHLVLEKYVQLITRHGVTQGIFLEGGLSRDGCLRPPKIGILDSLLKMKADPSMARDLLFVPVGINYDRVLEDEVLLRESEAGLKRSGFRAHLRSLLRLLIGAPWMLVLNLWRRLRGYRRRDGYAGVSFGEPVSTDAWLRTLPEDIFVLPREERRKRVKEFAELLMRRIADVIPVTPVPLVARLLVDRAGAAVDHTALLQDVVSARRRLLDAGAPVVMGEEFAGARAGRARLDSERDARMANLVSFEETFLDIDEARETLRIALGILGRRGIVRVDGDRVTVDPARRSLLKYYAHSVDHYFDPHAPAALRAGEA